MAAVASQRGHPALFGEVASKREQEHVALETWLPSAPRKHHRAQLGFSFWGGLLCFMLKNGLKSSFSRTPVPTGKNPAAVSWGEASPWL